MRPLSAPILLCKACESELETCAPSQSPDEPSYTVFIQEVTSRAYIVADSNKRRTVSRSDIAKAIVKTDQFDFLIDIVPRDDFRGPTTQVGSASTGGQQADTAVEELNGEDQVLTPSALFFPV